MKKMVTKFIKMNKKTKVAHLLVALLFFAIPFTGLVLESMNINIISFNILLGLYILTIATSLVPKEWKLVIIATIGSMFIWAITLEFSEVLWYYLKEFFGIDISYR